MRPQDYYFYYFLNVLQFDVNMLLYLPHFVNFSVNIYCLFHTSLHLFFDK